MNTQFDAEVFNLHANFESLPDALYDTGCYRNLLFYITKALEIYHEDSATKASKDAIVAYLEKFGIVLPKQFQTSMPDKTRIKKWLIYLVLKRIEIDDQIKDLFLKFFKLQIILPKLFSDPEKPYLDAFFASYNLLPSHVKCSTAILESEIEIHDSLKASPLYEELLEACRTNSLLNSPRSVWVEKVVQILRLEREWKKFYSFIF